MNSSLSEDAINKFIDFLNRQDKIDPNRRANLAELRRSAADPLGDYRSIWILGSYLPDTDGWPFDAFRLVATLFAIHKQRFSDKELPKFDQNEKRRSFGASVRRLKMQLDGGEESLDKRFAALLDTPKEDLAIPLRSFIQRIASAERPIPIDYRRLLKDLLYWDWDPGFRKGWARDFSKRKWAREYWQADAALTSPETSSSDSDIV